MGFLAAATPWLIKGGSALVGMLAGKKAQSSAEERSPEEQRALAGAQGVAGGLQANGQGLMNQGLPYTQQAGNYFQTLLRGDRAAMSQATQGARSSITDIYSGAQRGLEQSGVRGAARDVAASELNREKAGRISSLVSGVQPGAAQQLAGMGATLTGQGGSMYGQAGNIYQNLLGQGFNNRVYARGEGEKAGTSIGSLVYDVASGVWDKFGKKSGGGPLNPAGVFMPQGPGY